VAIKACPGLLRPLVGAAELRANWFLVALIVFSRLLDFTGHWSGVNSKVADNRRHFQTHRRRPQFGSPELLLDNDFSPLHQQQSSA
jgi:hypothetical protein